MSDLLPVGSDYYYCNPPSRNSSKAVFTLWRYKVAGYSRVRVGHDGDIALTLEPIDKWQFPATRWKWWLGEWRPVPPAECLPYLDDVWRALAESEQAK